LPCPGPVIPSAFAGAIDAQLPICYRIGMRWGTPPVPQKETAMFRASGVIVLAFLVLAGCGKQETAAERRQRRAHAALEAASGYVGLLKTPLQMYRISIGTYPTTKQGLEALRTAPGDLPKSAKWDGPYLDAPVSLDPWDKPYQYASPGTHNRDGYDVWSCGPDGVSGTQDDIGNW
jgi:type II secretion system protein G